MYADAIESLKSLQKKGFCSFKILNEWSDIYQKLYSIAITNKNSIYSYRHFRVEFMRLYEKIMFFLNHEKYESYFKVQLDEYLEIQGDIEKIKKWLKRSEYLMVEDLFPLGFEYYEDQFYEERSENIEIYIDSCPDFRLEINSEGIKNFIDFSKIYYDLYYSNEYLKDSEKIQIFLFENIPSMDNINT